MYNKKFKRSYPRPEKCHFCVSRTLPDYKVTDGIRPYLSDRGRIISRARSGICTKHQRQLAQEIKRARYLALLPFETRV